MGFFPPTKWNKQREPMPVAALCGKCKLHEKCKSPFTPVTGRGRLKTLIVGESPGLAGDEAGRPWAGSAHDNETRMLWEVGVNFREDCWLTNALICRPTDERGKDREPTKDEVGYCRPNLVSVLEKYKPERILTLGKAALQSVLYLAWRQDVNEYDGVDRWAGYVIPSMTLNAWVIPTYHPNDVFRDEASNRKILYDASRNRAVRRILIEHRRKAFTTEGRPFDIVPDYRKLVRILRDPDEAAAAVRKLIAARRPVAFDFENTPLKPYSQDSKILCCSASDGAVSYAFPWAGAAVGAVKELITDATVPKVAANLMHEEQWCWQHLRTGVRGWLWDTVLGGHWLNCRGGAAGLKFQAFVLFGVPDYSYHLDKLISGGGSYTHNKLESADRDDLLLYCGLDSLLEILVADRQRRDGGFPPILEG